MPDLGAPVLDVRGLKTVFRTRSGEVHAVNRVSFTLARGELLGVVGESGSGKSVTMMSLVGLLPTPPAEVRGGQVMLGSRDLLQIPLRELQDIRGAKVGFVFQDPMTSLNPVFRVGDQIMEPLLRHMKMTKAQARARAIELLELVGIPDAAARMKSYPHQFSGGMRQRVMIAIALACDPDVLIADEPTTALDVTIQAQILELVKELRQKLGMAIIWITHDLGVIAGIADRVMVMYGGQVVEQGPVGQVFKHPAHPYTRALLKTVPALHGPRAERLMAIEGQPPILMAEPTACPFAPRCAHVFDRCRVENPARRDIGQGHDVACHWEAPMLDAFPKSLRPEPLVKVRNLKMYFPIHTGLLRRHTGDVKAVDGVSFDIMPGETLGLVGESGCGKSTVGRALIRLYEPTAGSITIAGDEITTLSSERLRKKRPQMQMVFQDPQASLNPRMTLAQIIGEPLVEHSGLSAPKRLDRIYELMDQVGLNRRFANRYPHEFSGGQRQRIGIARALALNPKFIVCDEPIAALDVSIQAQVVNLLEDLQNRLGLTYLFISHDLSMVRHIADRVAVMYLGRIAELSPRDALYAKPLHPYAEALLSAVPEADPDRQGHRIILKGDVPSPAKPPRGCAFCTRCPKVMEVCRSERPVLTEVEKGRFVACHLYKPAPEAGGHNNLQQGVPAMKLKAALLGAASLAFAGAAMAERGSDGHVNVLYWQAPSLMNPYLSGGTKEIEVSSLVIEPLAGYDEKGVMFPRLAAEIPTVENGGVSADLTTITWKLKDGVMWSDGTPVTADDAVFTWQYCTDPAGGCAQASKYDGVKSVEAVDAQTIKVTFAAPKPNPYTAFVGSTAPILQKAQFANCLGAAAPTCTDANNMPIGTGPFKVTSFKTNDTVEMEANPNYRDAAKPAFATLTVKGGGDAEAAARAVLETGEIDYAWNTQVNPELQAAMAAGGKGVFVNGFGTLVERIEINLTDPSADLAEGERSTVKHPHPILSDIKVRKALSMAIDRQALVDVGYGTAGRPTCNVVPAPEAYASPNTDCIAQDMEGAKKLLDEAGWVAGADGIREKDGKKLKIVYQSTVNPVRQDFQALVKAWWNELGVDVELKSIDASVFFGGDPASPDTYQKFYADVEMFANNFDGTDPEAYLAQYKCDKIPSPETQWQGENINRFCDPAYDALATEMAATSDMTKRQELAKKMNEMVTKDSYTVLPLVDRGRLSAASNTLGGVVLNVWDSEMWNAQDWTRLK